NERHFLLSVVVSSIFGLGFLMDRKSISANYEYKRLWTRCQGRGGEGRPGDVMQFFAQLSSYELGTSLQVMKRLVSHVLKQVDGAKNCITPDGPHTLDNVSISAYTL